jgi:co-chaperonin GroES (HSP10)
MSETAEVTSFGGIQSEHGVKKFKTQVEEQYYEPRNTFNEIDVEHPIAELAWEAAENLPQPAGWKILIAIPRLKEATRGGIVKAAETLEREQQATIVGFVIALGKDCYTDKTRYSLPWCKEGDFILMRSYAGTRFMYLGQEYRFINEDVVEGVTPDPRGITKAG